ncbi:MAG TPA: glycosyl hydrolase family 18 protein, partial [Puia sp.]|nr:glycosyl hydrolase family 18 protein [Puia sp.]
MRRNFTPLLHGPLCRVRYLTLLFFLLFFDSGSLFAQVSPPVTATTSQHNKQVIGYITQWDAWKNVSGLVPQGGYNQLNVDYSQYTILNFSFFGVAVDGSLHSGDFRNQNIYQVGAVQNPAPIVDSDTYSSWDMYLLNGELTVEYYISDGDDAYVLGYRNQGSGWTNINTGTSGSFPLSVHKQGGAPGVIDLAHQKGVKVMASIGGWSMCKHYPEMAGDATKRANFIAGCQKLISMGFDGIDLDWEYPNDPGMDIEHYSTADYTNYAVLVEQIRAAIGSTKLITGCFSAAPAKLQGFDWARLNNTMNFFNIMTYDYNGGWSNKAGHNAPLYDYPGAEFSSFSLDATVQSLKQLGVNMSKVTVGAPFYGRGVITSSAATLNGATVKRAETVQPDGPIQTCADFTNWPVAVWAGTPNYSYILQTTGSGSGWTDHWDDVAKVPYMTNGNYFLSYDNPRSITAKAQYIKDNGLAGAIVWNVYGDMINMTSSTVAKGKLIYCPNTQSPLVNTINQVFAAGGTTTPGNTPPTVSLTAPAANASFTAPATITLQATAADADGTVTQVQFFNGGTSLGTVTTAPYTFTWSNVAAGTYTLTAVATDNSGATTTSSAVSITVNSTGSGTGNCTGIATWSASAVYTAGNQAVYNGNLYTAKWWTQGNQPDINTG